MTKTLTKQWREGTLPGRYYYIRVKERGEEKIIEHKITGSAFFYDQNVLLEIVAPVPSYQQLYGPNDGRTPVGLFTVLKLIKRDIEQYQNIDI